MLMVCVQQLHAMVGRGCSSAGRGRFLPFLSVLLVGILCVLLLPGGCGALLLVNNASGDNMTAAFFYSEHCFACTKALPVVDVLASEYPSVSIVKYHVAEGTENESLFFSYGEAYGNPYPRYPIVFLSDGVFFEGYRAISVDLPDHLASFSGAGGTGAEVVPEGVSAVKSAAPSPTPQSRSSSPAPSPPPSSSSPVTMVTSPDLPPAGVVIAAGLIDGINPCAVAVLIFLLLTLAGAGGRVQMLRFGGAYVAGIYLMYFISGFGVLSAVRVTGYSLYFSFAAGIVVIILGGIMLVDSCRAPEAGHFRVSPALLDSVRHIAARGGVLSAFLVGVAVSLIELPCTGGVYLAILGMLSGAEPYAAAGYLALYNLMFVLPLVVIIAAAAGGFSPERMAKVRLDVRQALLRLGGCAMVLLGVAVFIGVYI